MCRNRLMLFIAATFLSFGGIGFQNMNVAKADYNSKIELATVCVDELCGYVNSKGEWHIPPKFAAADPFSKEGLAWVITNGHNLDFIIKKDANNWVTQNGFKMNPDIRDKMAQKVVQRNSHDYLVTQIVRKETTWVNESGQSYTFDTGYSQDAVAIFTGETDWRCHSVHCYNQTLETPVAYGGSIGLINTYGEFVLQSSELGEIRPYFSNGLAAAKKSGKWGFIDTSGKWIIEPKFDNAWNFSDGGLAAAEVNKKWGIIDKSGHWIVEPKYHYSLFYFGNGLTGLRINHKWRLIDAQGQWLNGVAYDEIGHKSEFKKLTSVKADGKWGVINPAGEWVIKPEFDYVSYFLKNGLAHASKDGKWGVIDSSSRWIVEPKFEQTTSFSYDGSFKAQSNGKWGVRNNSGQWIVEPEFDGVYFNDLYCDKMITVSRNHKYGLVDTEGKLLLKPEFDHIYIIPGQNLVRVKKDDKYGTVDLSGAWVAEPKFDYINAFPFGYRGSGLQAALFNGQWGFINAAGQWAIKPKFSGMSRSDGLLQWTGLIPNWIGVEVIRGYVDISTGAYRTGLNDRPVEQGFRWDFKGGVRTLYNRQGEKILTIDPTDETEVVKNANGEIIWPLESATP